MAPSKANVDPGKGLAKVTVSRDELNILEFFRSMKFGKLGSHSGRAEPSGAAGTPLSGEAVVILHEKYGNEFKFGFVNFGSDFESPDFQDYRMIPMSANEGFRVFSNDMGTRDEDPRAAITGGLDAVSEHFERAEAVHARAREIIDRYDATSRIADECSRRTRELLSQVRR